MRKNAICTFIRKFSVENSELLVMLCKKELVSSPVRGYNFLKSL